MIAPLIVSRIHMTVIVVLATGWVVATAGQTTTTMVGPNGTIVGVVSAGPPRDNIPEPTGTGRLRGRVVDVETGKELRDSVLQLSGGGLRQTRTVGTDDEGRFEFENLPPGRFNVSATKPGYMTLAYGQRRPFEAGRPIELADKQTLEGIDFAVPRGGVIVARVTDEQGEPMSDVRVVAQRYRFTGAQRTLVQVSGLGIPFYGTDDRGEMRIYGLPPGEYYVSTAAILGNASMGIAEGGKRYVPTFYPGTTSVDTAERVSVQVGKEVSVSITLAAVKLARVSGVVRRSDGSVPQRTMVLLASGTAGSNNRSAAVQPDGTFSVPDVAPGEYTVQASSPGTVPTDREMGRAAVAISGADVSGVVVTTGKGGTIRGRVSFDAEPPANVRLSTLRPQIASGNLIFATAQPNTQDDGKFTVEGIFEPGLVRVGALPVGSFLKSVTLNGKDVTDVPVSVEGSAELTGVEILLTQKRAELSGTAADEKGTAITDYTAVVFPEDRSQWTFTSRFIFTARPDQQGRFRVTGLPPGRYLATALDYLETGTERDPDVLDRLKSRATAITLVEGEPATLTLVVQ